jgi:hypothetical protein
VWKCRKDNKQVSFSKGSVDGTRAKRSGAAHHLPVNERLRRCHQEYPTQNVTDVGKAVNLGTVMTKWPGCPCQAGCGQGATRKS